MTIGFLAIGDELLDGRVLDRNGAVLGTALAERGLSLSHKSTIPDDFSAISGALDTALGQVDLLIVSGGLGPTVDDMTSEALARWVGEEQHFRPEVWSQVQGVFSERGLPCPDTNKRQAIFPRSARVINNSLGTAPGFEMVGDWGRIICLPGVHREFCHMLEQHVFPVLPQEDLSGNRRHMFRLLGARESSLATLVDPIPLEPGESIHYQPSFPDLTVLLRARDTSDQRWESITTQLRATLNPWLYGEGEGRIGEVVVTLLKDRNLTLSSAESCTGGIIGQLVTAVPGASRIYQEGVITYSNEAKIRLLGVQAEDLQAHGAVSREVVIQMARGCLERSGSSVAIATSGIAGPGGGSPEKPVGTVHVALAVQGEAIVHQRLQLKGSRKDIQIRSAWGALRLLVDRFKLS